MSFVGYSYVHGLTCGESMRDFERGLYEGEVFNTEQNKTMKGIRKSYK
jgi:hypothetical protein